MFVGFWTKFDRLPGQLHFSVSESTGVHGTFYCHATSIADPPFRELPILSKPPTISRQTRQRQCSSSWRRTIWNGPRHKSLWRRFAGTALTLAWSTREVTVPGLTWRC